MKEANQLPVFKTQNNSFQQAHSDFHDMMKEYKAMKMKNRHSNLTGNSFSSSDRYNTHSNSLNNVRYLKEEAKSRKGKI